MADHSLAANALMAALRGEDASAGTEVEEDDAGGTGIDDVAAEAGESGSDDDKSSVYESVEDVEEDDPVAEMLDELGYLLTFGPGAASAPSRR